MHPVGRASSPSLTTERSNKPHRVSGGSDSSPTPALTFFPKTFDLDWSHPMARFSPLKRDLSASLHSIQNELNRLFEEYWSPSRIGPAPAPTVDIEPSAWTPSVDLCETPEEFVLIVDIPGVDPSSIDLSVTGNVLTLR